MGTAIVKLKIMPESPSASLDEIEKKAKIIIDKVTTMPIRIEKEPVAFGLVALIVTFAIDESQSIEEAENLIKNIPDVSSAEVIDLRRAFG